MLLSVKEITEIQLLKGANIKAGKETMAEKVVEWVSVIESPVEIFVRENEFVLTTGIGCYGDVREFMSIHILIDCSSQHYIPNIMKALKGNSARFLFKEFPDLQNTLWGGHLWNPSYFVSTVSDRTEEQIKTYIQGQQTARGKRGRPKS